MASARGIRAGAAYVELYLSDSRLVRGLQSAEKRLKAFGEGLRSVGTRMVAIGAAIAAPLLGGAKAFADMGSALFDMSQRTGISVEALSELGFAAEQSGTDLATMETGIRKMQRSLTDAAQGSKTAIEALGLLGLTIEDFKGLSPEQQFKLIADRIAQIADPTIRAAAAMELFGRSGTQLLPMLSGGAKGIEDLQAQARSLGLTMSTEDAKAAEAFGDTLDVLWKTMKRLTFAVGAALAPMLTDLAESMTRVIVRTTSWLQKNRQVVVTVLKVAAAVVAGGIALLALGYAATATAATFGAMATVITGVGAAIGVLGTIIAALLSPIGLVVAAVVGLAAYLLYTTGAGGEALRWLGERFTALKDTATAAFRGIADALAAGDIGLAAKILWLTLKMEFEKGVAALQSAWLSFKHFFIDLAYKAFYGVLAAAETVWHGLEVAWIETVAFLSKTWTNFTSGFQSAWATATTWVEKRIHDLWGLLDEGYDAEAAKQLADSALSSEVDRIEAQRQQAMDGREQKRQRDRNEAAELHEGTLAVIGQEYEDARKGLEDEYQRKISESEADLAKARQEWEDAIAEAARKRAATGEETTPGGMRGSDVMDEIDDRLSGLGDLLQKASDSIDVRGTFNAAAVQGLASGADVAERTAKASEQTARNTRRLVDAAMTGGLAFT